MEIWRDVLGYEGLYQVSSEGRVKTISKDVKFKNRWGQDAVRHIDEKIMKTKVQQNDYDALTLSKDGVRKTFCMQRLVATAFIPNPENKPQVDHIDGNKHNNCVENLRWVTAAENCANPLWVEHSKNISDETRRKMSEKSYRSHNKPIIQYNLNGEMVGIFDSTAIASRFYGINRAHICQVLKNKRKTAGGYVWRYKKEVA